MYSFQLWISSIPRFISTKKTSKTIFNYICKICICRRHIVTALERLVFYHLSLSLKSSDCIWNIWREPRTKIPGLSHCLLAFIMMNDGLAQSLYHQPGELDQTLPDQRNSLREKTTRASRQTSLDLLYITALEALHQKVKTIFINFEIGKVSLGLARLNKVDHFKYLGSVLTRYGYCTREIKKRIVIAKEAFNRKISLLRSKVNIELRKKLVRCYVWSIALYG